MHKLLICDLDGTLLDEQNKIDRDTANQIQALIASGDEFGICTGRLDEDIKSIERQFGFHSEYRISQNGCVIRDKQNRLVFEATLDQAIVPKINDVLFNYGQRVEVSDANHRYFPSPRDPKLVAEFVDTSIVKPNLSDFTLSGEMQPVIYLMFGNTAIFSQVRTALQNQVGDAVSVTQTSPNSLEVFSPAASKGKALAWIMARRHMNAQQVIVAGDAESDATMFQLTPYTFAVGPLATEAVIAAANYRVATVGEIITKMQGGELN